MKNKYEVHILLEWANHWDTSFQTTTKKSAQVYFNAAKKRNPLAQIELLMFINGKPRGITLRTW